MVTKDADFVESFLLRHEPWKLLLVSTGNIAHEHDLSRLGEAPLTGPSSLLYTSTLCATEVRDEEDSMMSRNHEEHAKRQPSAGTVTLVSGGRPTAH